MVQFAMELELSEQSVSLTRLFASSGELRMVSNSSQGPSQGHLRSTQCFEAKSDADLPQTIILKSESYNFMSCCPRLPQSQSRGGWFHL